MPVRFAPIARIVLAIAGMALIVLVASVVTVLNGSESEAGFSWGRQISYLAISATLLVVLAWVGAGTGRYRLGTRTLIAWSVAAASFLWLVGLSFEFASVRS